MSPTPNDFSQLSIEERFSVSPGSEDFSSPENEAPEEEQLVWQLHNALTTPKHFSFNPNAAVFVPNEEQHIAEPPNEVSTDLSEAQSADGLERACQKEMPPQPQLTKASHTNEDTTTVCCVCESLVPSTPLTLDFCESCSPITSCCKTLHVRIPQNKTQHPITEATVCIL